MFFFSLLSFTHFLESVVDRYFVFLEKGEYVTEPVAGQNQVSDEADVSGDEEAVVAKIPEKKGSTKSAAKTDVKNKDTGKASPAPPAAQLKKTTTTTTTTTTTVAPVSLEDDSDEGTDEDDDEEDEDEDEEDENVTDGDGIDTEEEEDESETGEDDEDESVEDDEATNEEEESVEVKATPAPATTTTTTTPKPVARPVPTTTPTPVRNPAVKTEPATEKPRIGRLPVTPKPAEPVKAKEPELVKPVEPATEKPRIGRLPVTPKPAEAVKPKEPEPVKPIEPATEKPRIGRLPVTTTTPAPVKSNPPPPAKPVETKTAEKPRIGRLPVTTTTPAPTPVKEETKAGAKPEAVRVGRLPAKAAPKFVVEELTPDSSEEDDDSMEEFKSRSQVEDILKLHEIGTPGDVAHEAIITSTFKELKKTYESAIKPLETTYKYKFISSRLISDAEIFSKPMVLFLGAKSSGKTSLVNYLLGLESTPWQLRTGESYVLRLTCLPDDFIVFSQESRMPHNTSRSSKAVTTSPNSHLWKSLRTSHSRTCSSSASISWRIICRLTKCPSVSSSG